jgi:glutamine amidotransferase-like uncharacterized protein
MKIKISCILLILNLLCLSVLSSPLVNSESNVKSPDSGQIFGFVIPLLKTENYSQDLKVNNRIRHMVNDFLREKLDVYWASKNFTSDVNTINDELIEQKFFREGSFIIPFSENLTINKKIITIICDYNSTNEIEKNEVKIPIYQLVDFLEFEAHKLNEVKVIQIVTEYSSQDVYYVNIGDRNGFLNFECIDNKNIPDRLNNQDHNVICWPGAFQDRIINIYISTFLNDLKKDSLSQSVRSFVNNGGGYIGSCYGAYIATSCVFPAPLYFIRRISNPELRSYGIFALVDVMCIPTFKTRGIIKHRIQNDMHPVTYGVDEIVYDVHGGGPLFIPRDNVDIITRIEDDSVLNNRPGWISSEFGEGKVTLFTSHPEIDAFDKKRKRWITDDIISNSFYHSNSEEKKNIKLLISMDSSVFRKIFHNSENLSKLIDNNSTVVFNEIKNRINETKSSFCELLSKIVYYKKFVKDMAEEKNIDISSENIKIDMGYEGLNWSAIYFRMFINYLNETLYNLEKNENIFSNSTFMNKYISKIDDFKKYITKKLDEIEEQIPKWRSFLEKYTKRLERKENRKYITIIERRLLTLYGGFALHQDILDGFETVPPLYFRSLAFLRHNWYEYETLQ